MVLDSELVTDARSEEQASAAVDVSINAQSRSSGSTLPMTYQVLVHAPGGSSLRVRGLLDSGSSASFISERMSEIFRLRCSTRDVQISGVAGITDHSPIHSVASFEISPLSSPSDKINVSAMHCCASRYSRPADSTSPI